MGKRHPNIPAWQWRTTPESHRNSANLVLQLIAGPLFIVGFLLIASGVFAPSAVNVAIGAVAVVAALSLQRRGHSLQA